MKKSIKLFTTAFSILLILNGVNIHALEAVNSTFSEYKLEIIEKTELTNENIDHCTSTVLLDISDININRFVNINGIENPLYCTFENQVLALENIKKEASVLLGLLESRYKLSPLSNNNWKLYRIKMLEFYTIPTEQYNESNEDFIKLRAFFDIYENEESNNEILNYINANKLGINEFGVVLRDSITLVDLGLLFPYYAPISNLAENIVTSKNLIQPMSTINVQPAVDYATTYATNRNTPTYYSFSNGDCTNFVSQILEASGVAQVVYDSVHSGWWHKRVPGFLGIGWTHTHSRSWTIADTFARYMGITYSTKNHPSFSSNIQRGDFIAADFTSDGNWDHSGFVTDRASYSYAHNGSPSYYDYKVAQHTPDYHDWTSSSTNGWENTSDGRTYARIRR